MVALKTWTLTVAGAGPLLSAFSEGMLNNVSDMIVADQLQLPSFLAPSSLPFLNIPVVTYLRRFRSDTGAAAGDYLVRPETHFSNPSRTSVDQFGNAWVGNRDAGDVGDPGGEGTGSVCKIGLVVGGTRVDADGTPNAAGEYLAPPYQYNTIVPHSGNTTGFIRTSRAFNNQLAWPTGSGVADDALDDAIQVYRKAGSRYTRFVCVDDANNVWVAGQDTGGGFPCVFERLDGVTGSSIRVEAGAGSVGGHGGIVHSSGLIFTTDFGARLIVRFDPTLTGAGAFSSMGTGGQGPHNMCEDSNGDIWFVTWGSALWKINTSLVPYAGFPKVLVNGFHRGVVCTFADSHIWVVDSALDPRIRIFDLDGNPVATISPASSANARGLDVDAAGKVWYSAFTNTAMRRIDPGTNLVDLSVSTTNSAYAYADFSGVSILSTANPSGVWTAVFDAVSITNFALIWWTATVPATTGFVVQYRIANTQIGLASLPWVGAVNNVPFGRSRGRFMEVQAIFSREFASSATPILFDLTIEDQAPPMIVVLAECQGYLAQSGAEQGWIESAGAEEGCVHPLGGR